MAKPGEQFILRREVFRLIQEAFRKQGIGFAPRRVVVEAIDRLAIAPAAAAGGAAVADGTDAAQPG